MARRSSSYLPRYLGDSPAHETKDLIPTLVMMNQFGFVTTCSQPGIPIEEGSGQRAFIHGICSAEMAGRICDLLIGSDLVVVTFPPMTGSTGQIVVTLDGWSEFTWCGIHDSNAEADSYAEEVGPELGELVRSSWTLQIIDPQWGRNDLLWPSVLGALLALPR